MAKTLSEISMNYISSDYFRGSFEAQTSRIKNTIKKLSTDLYTPDLMGGIVFFAGIVMDVTRGISLENNPYTSFAASFSGESVTTNQYKIFIPELHSGIISIEKFPFEVLGANINDLKTEEEKEEQVKAKLQIQNLLTAVDFRPSSTVYENISIGDPVWIIFQNSKNRENGFVFSKILADTGVGAGAPDTPIKKSNLNPSIIKPPSSDKPRDKSDIETPPGWEVNKSYVTDYSLIIQLSAESKGYPYRWWGYPVLRHPDRATRLQNLTKKIIGSFYPRAIEFTDKIAFKTIEEYNAHKENFPASSIADPWEYIAIGTDCTNYVCKFYKRVGITTSIKHLFNIGEGFKENWIKVDAGQQVPGDIASHGSHVTIVISYPDSKKENDSLVWGSHGPGPLCDRCWAGGVGFRNVGANTDVNNSEKYFIPVYANSISHGKKASFYRLKKQYVSPDYVKKLLDDLRIAANEEKMKVDPSKPCEIPTYEQWLKNSSAGPEDGWPIKPEKYNLKCFPKTNEQQYEYPKAVENLPNAIISAPDNFKAARIAAKAQDV